MKLKSFFALTVLTLCAAQMLSAAEPLRVFIRAGVKTHGPNQHDHPRFLAEYTKVLADRGMKVDGALKFPTGEQLEKTDVVVVYAADGMKITGPDRVNFEKFLQRGGGVVVIHDGVVSGDENEWCKSIIGGAWIWPKNNPGKTGTKWLEGQVGVFFVDGTHPISRGLSNFDWKDEIYYDLDMAPDVFVLATSFHDINVILPQLWTYEKTLAGGSKPYRAFVSIPGHEFTSFEAPQYRAILLRGIAWAGQHANPDQFCSKEELASLKYPPGGPVPAAKAIKEVKLHPEFNITLAADENIAEKIMSVEWDTKGRMWVAETPEYPNGRMNNKNDLNAEPNKRLDPKKYPIGAKEDRPGRDRISMLEDTDGDGVMDKKTVFADGLELVTSLVFYKDGVIVAQAPDFLWIRDTDGDGKADKVEKILTGWGVGDTHAVTSNLRWGPDGWIYGSVGYSAGTVSSGDGSKKFGRISAGIYRFRPDGSALEQVAAGGCNQWGCEVAPDGEIIFTTATCGAPICHVVMPEKFLARGNVGGHRSFSSIMEENKIYPPFKETRKPYVQIDWVGAWTAATGSAIYDGGAWPGKWAPDDRYSFFLSEATMHIFHHEFLDPKGSTYQGRKEEDRKETHFMTSTDYWFRPIHSRVGPDGAMYVVDFYNQIAGHNDTRGPKVGHGARNAAVRPDRDHHFTRVYRVQHNEAVKLPPYKLDAKDPAGLVTMLSHPNGWVRATANRLLNEAQPAAAVPALTAAMKTSASKYGRIQALHALNNLGQLDDKLMVAGLTDKDPAVRKNAARLSGERTAVSPEVQRSIEAMLHETDGRARINAVMALGSFPATAESSAALVALWPSAAADKFMQSAIIGTASQNPGESINAVLVHGAAGTHAGFVSHLVRVIAAKGEPEKTAAFVIGLSQAPASGNDLKAVALESLAANSKIVPAWTTGLQAALKTLMASPNSAVVAATVPLIGRWDKDGVLAGEIKPLIGSLTARLADKSLPDGARAQAAANLLGVRSQDAGAIPAVAKLLGPDHSPGLQRLIVEALGNVPDAAAGQALVAAYPKLAAEPQEAAFAQIIKRPDSSAGLMKAIQAGAIDGRTFSPSATFRLKTHPDKNVAKLATDVFDSLRGPVTKEKDTLVVKFQPTVDKPGDLANGKKLFEANCQGCHKFKGQGRDLAPDLTGMGVHGAHELLIHILDPNRVVEENFLAISIETKDGESYDGVVATENNVTVKLRNATTDLEIQKKNIKSRRSTGRSLMPEGFEALGGEGLRDLIAFISSADNKYRIVDLAGAFTADSTKGIYASKETVRESVHFKKFGVARAGEIPFDIASPAKTPGGNNLVVLKGKNGLAGSYAQRVEAKVPNVTASRIHLLGGIAGWGWRGGGDDLFPAAKITLTHADGEIETWTLTNGVHLVDYNAAGLECPGSKKVDGIVTDGQIRLISRAVKGKAPITKIVLESFDTITAPTFAAVTLELGVGGTVADAAIGTPDVPVVKPVSFTWGKGIKTLIVGGGSSHDFGKWYDKADSATLSAGGLASVNYTDKPINVAPALKDIDVLVQTSNQNMKDGLLRQAIMDFADAGKGLVLVHPALWYNWADWPEYNRVLVGGGSRGHDRFGEFEVKLSDVKHPVTAGVAASFKITDELYNSIVDPKGTPIQVLATATSPVNGKVFPSVWIVQHPKARIVCIALGHDGKAHDHEAYQKLLQNAVKWAAGK